MAKKIANSYDFLLNEIKQARIWNQASLPGASASYTGAILFNTSDSKFYFCTGTTWKALGNLNEIAAAADVSLNNFKLTNVGVPTASSDAATKDYVDQLVRGLAWKESARVSTTANITLSGTQTIDGITVIVGDRVLVKNQTNQTENGVYVVSASAWSRSVDMDTASKFIQATIGVREGTTQADTTWTCNNDTITIGTTSITFVQSNGSSDLVAGTGMVKSGTTINVQGQNGVTVSADYVELAGQALAIHNLSTNGFVVRTASGVFAARTIVAATASSTIIPVTVSNGDGVSANPSIGIPVAGSGGTNGSANTVARSDHSHDGTYSKRVVGTIGNGSSTTLAIAHNLNSQYPIVQLWEVSSGSQIECDITFTDANNLSLVFTNYTPTSNGVRYIIEG